MPHIFAADAPGMFHAFGWAQMAAHGDLLLELYGQARGRAAEYWGAGHLQGDQYVRAMGVPARARDWYEAQSPPMRAGLDAFADGINDYAKAHPERLDPGRRQVLPVGPEDITAHVQRVIHPLLRRPRTAPGGDELAGSGLQRLGRGALPARPAAMPCSWPTRTCPGAA